MTTTQKIIVHLTDHYAADDIAVGLAYAEQEGYVDSDDALSLTLSRILYSDSQLADGDRYAVEPGSW